MPLLRLLVALVALAFERCPALFFADSLTACADRVLGFQELSQGFVVSVADGVDQAHLLVDQVDQALVCADHEG